MPTAKLQMALLIDGDNAQPSLTQSLLEALENYGRCVIRRVYGDWTADNMNLSGWPKIGETHAIQLVQQSRYTAGKNANDIAITIAAMEIMQSGKVNAFCIVSSDSDFTPLVMRLKDEGVTVIVVGKATTPASLVNASSVFISTDKLNGNGAEKPAETVVPPNPTKSATNASSVKPANPANAAKVASSASIPSASSTAKVSSTAPAAVKPAKTPNARPLLKRAYEMANKPDEWMGLGMLGHNLHQLDPQFKPQTYGHKGLSQLVAQYEDVFEVRTEQGKGNTAQTSVRLKKKKG
ncbi:MAG: NYN domain-containing protein [Anaerolineae bacterium]|nr:NYN domain-containing protein [Anaerolineae bacterium]